MTIVERMMDYPAYSAKRYLKDGRIAQVSVSESIVRAGLDERPNRDILGFVIPPTWNLIEYEVLRVAEPMLDRLIAEAS